MSLDSRRRGRVGDAGWSGESRPPLPKQEPMITARPCYEIQQGTSQLFGSEEFCVVVMSHVMNLI